MEWIIKHPFFLISGTLSVGGCGGHVCYFLTKSKGPMSNVHYSGFPKHLQTKSNLHISISQSKLKHKCLPLDTMYLLFVRLHASQKLWVYYVLSSICIYLALSWLNEGGLKWKCVFFGPKLSRDEKGFVRSVYFSDY